MKNNNGTAAHKENEQTKHTSSARCKYSFSLLVEEQQGGVLQPQQKISMSGDVEVTEVRQFVRAAARGVFDAVGDKLGLNDNEPNPDPNFEEDPLPEDNPENPEE